MIRALVRLEGLTFFVVSVLLYANGREGWLFFALLFLTPDISMIGYLANKKLGAILYNTVHNYLLAVAILAWGMTTDQRMIVSYGLILFAHIGLDRALGLGLKYADSFKETHIQKL